MANIRIVSRIRDASTGLVVLSRIFPALLFNGITFRRHLLIPAWFSSMGSTNCALSGWGWSTCWLHLPLAASEILDVALGSASADSAGRSQSGAESRESVLRLT